MGWGLLLAAVILGVTQSLPWALAALGVVVLVGAVASQIVDDMAEQRAAARRPEQIDA